jgi:hypothetical protein
MATLTITGTESQYDLATFTVEAMQSFTGTAGLPWTLRLPAEITQVRWDFGDGSPYMATDTATIQRQYDSMGVYHVRAEVMDQYGHTALISGEVEIGNVVYMPLIFKNH